MSRWQVQDDGLPEPSQDDVIAATEPTRADVEAAMLELALPAHQQQWRPILQSREIEERNRGSDATPTDPPGMMARTEQDGRTWAARLRKLAEILSATSSEQTPSPAGLRSAARLLVSIATEIEQIRTAEEERADAVAHLSGLSAGPSEPPLTWAAETISRGDHVGAAKREG